MEDGAPGLEVGFAIDTGGSFESLMQLQGVMDTAEAKIVADAASIERATGGMLKLGTATASVTAFGAAATRELQSAARDLGRVEKSGEALVRQLERQNTAFGKTREEMRGMKAETAALAAEQQGLTELAARIRSTEGALFDKELASARSARFEAEAAAQAKEQAATEAVAAAAREAQAVREASLAYQMFEAAARKGMAALREQQALDAVAARQAQAARERAAAEEAVNAQLLERSRIEAALERNTGLGRGKATDAGATFSALAAQAAEEEARAQTLLAAATQRAADEHARLVAIVRGSQAAQEADAVAAERLRASTDPLYAATKRLNAEIAESTRLYHSGATAPAEYARQQDVLTGRMKATTEQHNLMAVAGRRNAQSLQMIAIQMPDVVQGLLSGQKPFQILVQQGGQVAQIAMMAEGGIKGLVKQLSVLALAAAPVLGAFGVAAGVAFGAFKLFQSQVKDSGELTRYRDSLGLMHKEMLKLSDGVESAGGKIKKLGDVTITAGDLMAGLWKTIKDTAQPPVADWSGFTSGAVSAFQKVLDAWGVVSAGITAGIYGTANAAKIIWQNFAASIGDAFYQSVNVAIAAMNTLVEKGTNLLNGFIHGANKIPGVNIGDLTAPQINPVSNPYEGAGSAKAAADAMKAIGDGYKKAYSDAKKADADFWKQVGANAKKNAKDRLAEEAAALKANRTPKKTPVDRNALNAEAIEAQIRNLYKLADAYGVSGAAALIAEARVKAESQAIKQRADVEAAVDRQVRLAIAQRVSDAAKGTANMREQAAAQEAVNAQVSAGIVPAERAAELIKNQIADLPLLDAIGAAQQRGLATEAARATKALADQRAERERLAVAERHSQFITASNAGDNQLAQLREELRLVGATDAARVHALATIKATQDAQKFNPADRAAFIAQQVEIADLELQRQLRADAFNDSLHYQADLLDLIATNVSNAARGMADAFGEAGQALGDLASGFASYLADQERLKVAKKAELDQVKQIADASIRAQREHQVETLYSTRSAIAQIGLFGDMTAAAKGFFDERSKGYKALQTAEQVFRAIEFALSVRAMAQDAAETVSSIAKSGARAAASAVEAVAKAIASLPFPANLVAGAATAAALASIGLSVIGGFGGGGKKPEPANEGTGTVFGDATAKSDSIKRAIDSLKEVDLLTNTYSRQMAASLRSIESQIGGLANVIVRGGDINASAGVTEGFKPNIIGSVLGAIPLIGGFLSSLFGSKTDVTASGLYGGPQSIGSILGGGFNAQSYSDITKTNKFFGITTGHSYSTQYGSADPALGSQFTLLLKQFNDAIVAAAGPLGVATSDIQNRLNSFVVNIGKVDLKGLTGQQIQEKLEAIFGAAADNMANAAFPGIAQFAKVGEGAFETLVRVASTVEAVTTALNQLGGAAQSLGIAAKLGLADQFDSIGDLTSAVGAYFDAFYTPAEQAAAEASQLTKVFGSLGLAMPNTLAGFRALVEAQDLTTAAGQATYATLLQLAPAFADLQAALNGAKSATDIASERADLQRQLLELQGNTAAIRALDLAKLDASNRELQQQIWAIQDAQEAAQAAKELSDAWSSVGDSIADEIKRIRGLTDAGGGNSFATLQAQFNAASAAARAGDMDAAKSLPGLSQALLAAAADAATSRQELDRIQAQTAASLEATQAAIAALAGTTTIGGTQITPPTANPAQPPRVGILPRPKHDELYWSTIAAQAPNAPRPANDDLVTEVRALRDEVVQLRMENTAGHAATAGNTGAMKRTLEDVTSASGGEALSVAGVAA